MYYLLILIALGGFTMVVHGVSQCDSFRWALIGLAVLFIVKILAGAPPPETNLYMLREHHYGVSN